MDAAKKAAETTADRAKRFAPVRTGTLRNSITVQPSKTEPLTSYTVTAHVPYASYQERGTGPIHAKPGGVLAWRGNRGMVFVKHTKGVPATRFMAKARSMLTIADFY